MNSLRPVTKAYIAVLLLLALGATVFAAFSAPARGATEAFIAVVVAACMALAWLFPIPFAARTKLYVDTAVSIAAVLLLSPALAAVAVGAGTLAAHGIRRESRDLPQALFNTAQTVLVALAAALLLALAGWRPDVSVVVSPWPLLVLPVIAVATYLLNILLVAVVTALEASTPLVESVRRALLEDAQFEALAYLSLVTSGTLAALVAIIAPWGVPMLTVPVFATYFTMGRQARLRQQEEATRQSTAAALEAARGRSRLLTMASHDLRTPLTSIQGYIEMVTTGTAGELTDDQRELLDVARRNALQLTGLVNDLLDLSRIEAGQLQLRYEEIDVKGAIADVVSTLVPMAHSKGIDLVVQANDDHCEFIADPYRLNQILLNLVGNAVKFTDHGSVTVSIFPDADWIEIVVADTGIGIAPDALPHVFDDFRQGSEQARRRGGAGLGLAIVRQLVELHGGTISVDSVLGEGTSFRLHLPAAVPAEDRSALTTREAQRISDRQVALVIP